MLLRVVVDVEGLGTLQQQDGRQAWDGHPTMVDEVVEKRTRHRCDAASSCSTLHASAAFEPWSWPSACVAQPMHGRGSFDVASYDALSRVFASRVEFRTIFSSLT